MRKKCIMYSVYSGVPYLEYWNQIFFNFGFLLTVYLTSSCMGPVYSWSIFENDIFTWDSGSLQREGEKEIWNI